MGQPGTNKFADVFHNMFSSMLGKGPGYGKGQGGPGGAPGGTPAPAAPPPQVQPPTKQLPGYANRPIPLFGNMNPDMLAKYSAEQGIPVPQKPGNMRLPMPR